MTEFNKYKPTPFWLQICPTYIFDNFNRLITYLRQYNYDSINQERNSDYDSTVDVMKDMCSRYADMIIDSPLKLPEFDVTAEQIVRLFAATILADNKRSKSVTWLIPPFVSLMVMCHAKYQEDDLKKLAGFVRDAIIGLPVATFGFALSNVEEGQFSLDLMAHFLLRMKFKPAEGQPKTVATENNGAAILQPDRPLVLYPGNAREYFAGEKNTLFEVPGLMRLDVDSNYSERSFASFRALVNASRRLLQYQETLRPSEVIKRSYMPSDEFIVKITEKRNSLVVAETISHKHHRLTGKVNIQADNETKNIRSTLLDTLQVGDYLRVKLDPSEDFTFTTADTLREFYRRRALQHSEATEYAVYDDSVISRNHIFVTNDGIRFIIHAESEKKYNTLQKEAIDRAIDERVPIKVKLKKVLYDVDDPKFVIYANVEWGGEYLNEDDSGYFNVAQANREFVDLFLDSCADEADQLMEQAPLDIRKIGREQLSAFLCILNQIIKDGFDEAKTRVEYSTLAAMLSKIAGFRQAVELFESDLKIVTALVEFAKGEEIGEFTLPDEVAVNPEIIKQTELISALREYKIEETKKSAETTVSKVKKLIDASNNLRDILGQQELSAIKRIIARTIGVEDEFVSSSENRTFYGIESENLEFKSSIVFPPANRRRIKSAVADPALQKWAIIRTVCGFLNSQYGGELLLGVRDTGYALGIEEDIAELLKHQLIAFKSADAYRTYVQNIIDSAFAVENSPKTSSESITRPNVSYSIEKSLEGAEILRLKVAPYHNGVVEIKPAHDRPSDISDIYVRQSGRTVAVTDDMRHCLPQLK